MYIDVVPNRNSPPAVLLRESVRDGRRTLKRTLANLSALPEEAVAALRVVLRGGRLVEAGEHFAVTRSLPCGHVRAVKLAMQRLGMAELVGSKPSPERQAVLAMIAQRIVRPGSKLESAALFGETTLAEEFGVEGVDENALYAALDWLLERQPFIERKLAARHLREGAMVFYDVSSSSYHGSHCPLAKRGYNRDGLKLPGIVYGLLTDRDGRPVALRVYPGNYDEYMTAATQARERLISDNAKKKAQIADLQSFVSRFSANASKSSQATSRLKQIDKIKIEEVKVSSRQNPFIRFEQDKKLYRNILEVEGVSKGYGEAPLFKGLSMMLEVGEKVAILGTNGIGKSTLIKTLMGELAPDSGTIKWSENAQIGYYAQDHADDFDTDLNVFDWMAQWKQANEDEQAVRSVLGRLLFTQDDIKKPVKVLSGGEQGRMLFGKLMMQRPNILIMDEPTNHLDMESIESLNLALEMYQGTLIFVSHDREFVSSLATRIMELTENGIRDFGGTYEDYLRSQGVV